MSSIITSIFGLISAAGAIAIALGYEEIGGVLVAIGSGGIGLAARDNHTTSEEAGAK